MYSIVSVLVILVSLLLVLIVLVQNSKGGGLASNFSASNQIMGVRKTTDFLEKATWTLAGSLLVLSFLAVATLEKGKVGTQSVIDEQSQNIAVPAENMPSFPVAGEETKSTGDSTQQ
jgi:preprotein translocase subunit SecG